MSKFTPTIELHALAQRVLLLECPSTFDPRIYTEETSFEKAETVAHLLKSFDRYLIASNMKATLSVDLLANVKMATRLRDPVGSGSFPGLLSDEALLLIGGYFFL